MYPYCTQNLERYIRDKRCIRPRPVGRQTLLQHPKGLGRPLKLLPDSVHHSDSLIIVYYSHAFWPYVFAVVPGVLDLLLDLCKFEASNMAHSQTD